MNTCDTKNFYVAAPFSKCLHMKLIFFQMPGKCSGMCFVPFVITLIVGEILPFNELIKLWTNAKQVNTSVEEENICC